MADDKGGPPFNEYISCAHPGWIHTQDSAVFEVRRAVRHLAGLPESTAALEGRELQPRADRVMELLAAAKRISEAAAQVQADIVMEAADLGVRWKDVGEVLGKSATNVSNYWKKYSPSISHRDQLRTEYYALTVLESGWLDRSEQVNDVPEVVFVYGIKQLLMANAILADIEDSRDYNPLRLHQLFGMLRTATEALTDISTHMAISAHIPEPEPLGGVDDGWDSAPGIYLRHGIFSVILATSHGNQAEAALGAGSHAAFVHHYSIFRTHLLAAVAAFDRQECFAVIDSSNHVLAEAGLLNRPVEISESMALIERRIEKSRMLGKAALKRSK